MIMLNRIRNISFWTFDSFKGGEIKKAYKQIEKIDKLSSDDPIVLQHQKDHWKKLCEHICNTTDFYKEYAYKSLEEFPVVDKNVIRRNENAFFSSEYNKEKMIQMATSGSTGKPFISYQNSDKKKRVNAEIIYYSGKVGYKVGGNLSYIRSIVSKNKKSVLKQYLQNQTLIDCEKLDDKGVEKILCKLESFSKHGKVTLLAYGSTYNTIVEYIRRNSITSFKNIKLLGAISSSDFLFDETRSVIAKAFGNIPVVSRYSNMENGVIGQDEGINNVFPINEADYIIEILDENGNSVEEGTIGRIVITDLFNYAQPMVRYDTGDCGAIKQIEINGRRKKCICEFSGRKVDMIFNTKGQYISPYAISNRMLCYQNVKQFQLIQKGLKDFLLKMVIREAFDVNDITNELMQVLGSDVNIEISIVDEIQSLPSGKNRYIVNEIKGDYFRSD